MYWSKYFKSVGILTLFISPTILMFGAGTQKLLASYPEWKVSLQFPPHEDRSAPNSTLGGGARLIAPAPKLESEDADNSCNTEDRIPLTALMPTRENVAKTFVANPEFFWYIPKTNATAEFVLVDAKKNQIYRKTFALSNKAGVVKLSLPSNISLEVGKTYLWELALSCDRDNQIGDRFVQGAIQRTELSAKIGTKLEKSTLLERAKIYADAGMWPDTLTILAELRASQPKEWEELLKSVKLEAIATAPLIESVY